MQSSPRPWSCRKYPTPLPPLASAVVPRHGLVASPPPRSHAQGVAAKRPDDQCERRAAVGKRGVSSDGARPRRARRRYLTPLSPVAGPSLGSPSTLAADLQSCFLCLGATDSEHAGAAGRPPPRMSTAQRQREQQGAPTQQGSNRATKEVGRDLPICLGGSSKLSNALSGVSWNLRVVPVGFIYPGTIRH